MNEKYCQSCGMPLIETELYGKNKDGSSNEDYCQYCYNQGEFTTNVTMEEMIEQCVPHMIESGMDENQAREMMSQALPELKRWKQN